MNLKQYIQSSRGAAAELARHLQISSSFLSQLASGAAPISPERCVLLERFTRSAVMRWDLRPDDWHRIWPELVKRKDAPPIVSKAEA